MISVQPALKYDSVKQPHIHPTSDLLQKQSVANKTHSQYTSPQGIRDLHLQRNTPYSRSLIIPTLCCRPGEVKNKGKKHHPQCSELLDPTVSKDVRKKEKKYIASTETRGQRQGREGRRVSYPEDCEGI